MKHVVSWAPCLAQASPGETPSLRRLLPTLSCPTFLPSESVPTCHYLVPVAEYLSVLLRLLIVTSFFVTTQLQHPQWELACSWCSINDCHINEK